MKCRAERFRVLWNKSGRDQQSPGRLEGGKWAHGQILGPRQKLGHSSLQPGLAGGRVRRRLYKWRSMSTIQMVPTWGSRCFQNCMGWFQEGCGTSCLEDAPLRGDSRHEASRGVGHREFPSVGPGEELSGQIFWGDTSRTRAAL